MVEHVVEDGTTMVRLSPNRSASWFESKIFLAIMCVPMFIIAIGWTILGAWPILPFAGIDFLLLAYVTYRVCYRSYQHDWIKVEKDKITVHNGVGDKASEQVMLRSHTNLYVKKPVKPMDLIQLRLADHKTDLKIGEFLNQEDREQVRNVLIGAGIIECVDRWWD